MENTKIFHIAPQLAKQFPLLLTSCINVVHFLQFMNLWTQITYFLISISILGLCIYTDSQKYISTEKDTVFDILCGTLHVYITVILHAKCKALLHTVIQASWLGKFLLYWKYFIYSLAAQCVICKPASLISLEILLEMQSISPYLGPKWESAF